MQLKSAVLLLLALGCGLVAAIGVTQVVSKENAPPPQAKTQDSIFVAVQDIAQGDLITPDMVRLEAWPADRVPEGAFHKITDIDGCRARVAILEGEPLRDKKLLGKNATTSTPTDHIPKGYQVVGVKVDVVSGGGLIRPGDRVDVIAHFERDAEKDIPENRTQTILRDIKVFAVGDTYKLDPGTKEEDSIRAKTVSLLVTPMQAQKVVLASQLGEMQLVMRAPGDTDTKPSPGITPSELLGSSEAGNRKSEQQPGLPGMVNAGAGGIFDLLKGMQEKKEPEPPQTETKTAVAAPSGPQSWNVRMLIGSEVSDVTLEQQVDPATGKATWHTSQGGMPASGPTVEPVGPMPIPPAPTPPEPTKPRDPDL